MRRIVLGPGTLVLCLGTLMWATAPLSAQHDGYYPAVRVGSIHYGARPPVRYVPAVPPGAVRYGHYASPVYGGAFRNPYRADYFSHFRPGYRPFVLGGAQYYGYYSLPLGYQPVMRNGIAYYLSDGVYYQPYIYGGQTVYLVVPIQ